MPIFTFYFHETGSLHPTGEPSPSFEIGLYDDDDAAAAEGRRLLEDRPRYGLVEITSEGRAVATATWRAPGVPEVVFADPARRRE